jgi:Tol biopolymer transport system component
MLTSPGTAIGTVAYMSPEQALAQELDARTDLFSLGAVLYEMATGVLPFRGTSSAATFDAILHKAPTAPVRVNPDLPDELARIINNALEKERDLRYQSARELLADLKRLKRDSDASKPAIYLEPESRAPRSRKTVRWLTAAALMLVAVSLGTTWWITRSRTATNPPQFRRLTWDTGLTTDPTLSPDGRWLAYASDRSGEGNLDIWLQQLAGGEVRGESVRLTHNPADDSEPSFSPDGSQIAFTSARGGGGIYLISSTGGQERLLAKEGRRPRFAPNGKSLAYWVGSTYWLLAPKSFVMPLSGGPARQLQPSFKGVAFPTWSPDGSHLLFYGWKKQDVGGDIGEDANWWVTPTEGGTAVIAGLPQYPGENIQSSTLPEWISQGMIIFPKAWRDSADIWLIPISPKTLQVEGAPERLTSGTNLQIHPSVASGHLAFAGLTVSGNICALPVDHTHGKASGEIQRLTQDTSVNGQPSISADGTKLVYISERSGSRNGWIKDLRSGRATALLPESNEGHWLDLPKIARDGSKVAYTANTESEKRLFVANTSDLVARLLCEDCGSPADWFPDGRRFLLYFFPSGWAQIGAIEADSGERILVAQHSPDLIQPHVSPDGRWMAIHTDLAATRVAIMIAPLRNGVAAKEEEWVTVTDGSGLDRDANWSPDGNLLYFFSERDGFRCIWGQRLESSSKKPIGSAFPVYHSHDPSRSIRNIIYGYLCMSVSSNQVVFPMGELTGNIWITEFRHR